MIPGAVVHPRSSWEQANYPVTGPPVLTSQIDTAVVALGVIGKGIHWLYKWAQRIDGSLSYIEGEMRFNGGSTMRDAVKRIEVRIGVMEANQQDIRHDIKGDNQP